MELPIKRGRSCVANLEGDLLHTERRVCQQFYRAFHSRPVDTLHDRIAGCATTESTGCGHRDTENVSHKLRGTVGDRRFLRNDLQQSGD